MRQILNIQVSLGSTREIEKFNRVTGYLVFNFGLPILINEE